MVIIINQLNQTRGITSVYPLLCCGQDFKR